MYIFRDVNETSEGILLPSEALQINGEYIENLISGYRTLYVSGRESLGAEIEGQVVSAADGEQFKNQRYPARILTVGFQLIAESNSDFREKFNHLNNLLAVDSEGADFVFNDESDKFFTGYPIFNCEVDPGLNAVTGEWEIYCPYPFKRSVAVVEATPTTVNDHSAQFTINYNGTYPARPILQAEFAGAKSGGDYSDDGDCGFVAFIDDEENIIQLGNPDAIDLDAYTTAEQLVNREFTDASGFTTTGGKTFDNEVVSGSMSANQSITDTYWKRGAGQTLKFAKPTYGTDATHWHGPILWKQVRQLGAVNWNLSAVHRLCCNRTGECGSFELGAYNVTGSTLTMVAGILIIKDASGSNGTVKYIANGKVVKSEKIDLSYYNTHFGYCKRTAVYKTQYYNKKKKKYQNKKIKRAKTRKVRTGYKYTQSNLNTSISKSGSAVTFKVGNLAAYTYTNGDIENMVAHNLSMHFGQFKGIAALHTNAINSVRFTMNPTGTFADIPNVFTSGDIVEADCNDASVYLKHANTEEGQLAPQFGALGNDWEEFTLVKGVNIINAVWSDWVNSDYKPTLKILYNEVYI